MTKYEDVTSLSLPPSINYMAYTMERDRESRLKRNIQTQRFGSEQLPAMLRRI